MYNTFAYHAKAAEIVLNTYENCICFHFTAIVIEMGQICGILEPYMGAHSNQRENQCLSDLGIEVEILVDYKIVSLTHILV